MNLTEQTNNSRPWSNWQKILFRFFFVFLSLQVVTEDFIGNWFGSTLFIWQLGERIFVNPCLWLNNHFFHFVYKSPGWTSFSGTLHTIRDAIYLLIALLTCILWTLFDKKRTQYNRLYYWFSHGLVIALACIVFAYGCIKIFAIQMAPPSFISLQTPLGDMSPFDLLWATFGYGKPYQVFSGVFEVLGAVLILFRRTRAVGLVVIVSVMINVVLMNYTYQIGVLDLSFRILLVSLFLLVPYAIPLFGFFFGQKTVSLHAGEVKFNPTGKALRPKLFTGLLTGISFVLSIQSAYERNGKMGKTNQSRQYSMVKQFVVDRDTLPLIENDTTRWRFWSERIANGKNYVTITSMKPGVAKTYQVERDLPKHLLILHPFNQKDTASFHFNYTESDKQNWRMEGWIHQQRITAILQKVNPDTTYNLLKPKRSIITLNDETDAQ